jgi:hypothetical protein
VVNGKKKNTLRTQTPTNRVRGLLHLREGSSGLEHPGKKRRFISLVFLIVSLYSLLLWGYVCARILISDVDLGSPFINGIPITFWQLGLAAFITSFAAMLAYIVIREW